MVRRIEIGLLYSRSGSYALLSGACRTGALAAIGQVNADAAAGLCLVPVERDPGGNADAYGPLCEDILKNSRARHVIGCVTSLSRKEVIPTLEKHGGTLWYACPYEGFEASDHVVYTHACPNQHLLPLLDWAMPAFGRRVWLAGSNYIWGWEMNRLARATVTEAGGEVLGERYLPIGSTDVARMVEEVRASRPDFVLNNLIGPSSYAFLVALRAVTDVPVLSCNLTEAELPAIGTAAEGLIAAGPYFRGAATGGFSNSFEAAAHAAVIELARLLRDRPGAEGESLADLLRGAPGGRIDPRTHHTPLPTLIAQVRGGAFHVIQARAVVPGDPYLTRGRVAPPPSALRVVS